MWTLAGLAVAFLGAIHSTSYMFWLWDQGDRKAAYGVALLTLISVSLPVYTAVASNP